MAKLRRMHAIFIKQYLKQIMEYKVDFAVVNQFYHSLCFYSLLPCFLFFNRSTPAL